MRRSRILAKLRKDEPVLLCKLDLAVSPFAVQLAGRVGLDGVWICMEHRPWSHEDVSHMIAGALLGDVDAVVRIRKGEGYTSFFRPLEDGAAGIMVPHITTGEEAAWVVRNAKYPPLGRRGTGNMLQDADQGYANSLAYLEHANRETFVAIQIEDAEALSSLDEIIATDGVDILFIGPADLSVSLGIPFQFDHPTYRKAEEQIAEAAKRHDKWWGRPVADAASARAYMARGARFFNMGGDYKFIKEGLETARRTFDEALG